MASTGLHAELQSRAGGILPDAEVFKFSSLLLSEDVPLGVFLRRNG